MVQNQCSAYVGIGVRDGSESVFGMRRNTHFTAQNANRPRGIPCVVLLTTKDKKAIEDYNEAILIVPDDANIFLNRGRAYGRLGKYKQAIKDYSQAIQINPVYNMAYQARGLTYLIMDEDKLGCIDFRKNCELGECEDL